MQAFFKKNAPSWPLTCELVHNHELRRGFVPTAVDSKVEQEAIGCATPHTA